MENVKLEEDIKVYLQNVESQENHKALEEDMKVYLQNVESQENHKALEEKNNMEVLLPACTMILLPPKRLNDYHLHYIFAIFDAAYEMDHVNTRKGKLGYFMSQVDSNFSFVYNYMSPMKGKWLEHGLKEGTISSSEADNIKSIIEEKYKDKDNDIVKNYGKINEILNEVQKN